MTSRNELAERQRLLSAEKQALLATRLQNTLEAQAQSSRIPRVPQLSLAPPSFAQERLWFLHQLDPLSCVYHCPANLRLCGPLSAHALKQAWHALLERHEVLRTSFPIHDGRPVQRIDWLQPPLFDQIDLSALPRAERECEARRLAVVEGSRPFDLHQGPLVRARLLRLGEEDHVLLRTMHHYSRP